MLTRRLFLGFLAAPAIVRAASLMHIKPLISTIEPEAIEMVVCPDVPLLVVQAWEYATANQLESVWARGVGLASFGVEWKSRYGTLSYG